MCKLISFIRLLNLVVTEIDDGCLAINGEDERKSMFTGLLFECPFVSILPNAAR